MTDYTDLIFIEPQDSINTKAAQAIRQLVAERDAAFAMSKCECESSEACKNLVALHDEVERLKSALREALGDIETVFRGRWLDEQGPPIHKAITTINEALK